MEQFFSVLPIVAPVFIALLIGYFSKRKRLVTPGGIEGMKALVMNFALPAVIIGAFYTVTVDTDMAVVVITMFCCGLTGLLLGKLLRWLLRQKQDLLPFLVTSYETGMLGYGLYIMLFSQAQVSNFAMIDLGEAAFAFTIYIGLLNARKGVDAKSSLRSMVKTPMIWAVVAGIALGATGIGRMLDASPIGPAISEVLAYISAPTGILMLFVVGYELEWTKEYMKDALVAAGLRFCVMALLCFLAVNVIFLFLPFNEYLFWGLVLVFSLPAPYILPLFISGEKDNAYVATSLALYTVISIVLFTVIACMETSGVVMG
ncbi:AEC family transporter [Christensenella tenuis]|jgi:malate permease and related proteins|uniref:Transporter n=1 Tax=Christensenella tenuis TaxID=2763033 RepID=A0ABR7EJA3_9FIRM|nr:hypothetical protein [Christensenella tenuis]MBC5649089.1 hypothetical protein [Christensenella tenuis]